jgi:hypothetical protein
VRHRIGIGVVAAVSLLFVGWIGVRSGDHLRSPMVGVLQMGLFLLPPAPESEVEALPDTAAAPVPVSSPGRRARTKAPVQRRTKLPVPRYGVRIRAATVLHLANSGVEPPTGTPVMATASHPAGLVLNGVSGLGIGMRDGDILTHASGRAVSSPAHVVAVVIAARAARAPEIAARFWRNGEPWNLIVEQPYID